MRARHYSPQLSRLIVAALYHEGQRRKVPMTRLADALLGDALRDTYGMARARALLSSARLDGKITQMSGGRTGGPLPVAV